MRITDSHRQAVKQAHAEGKTRNQIARDIGISPGSVTTICKDADLTFDRTAIKSATEARAIDSKAVRADLSSGSIKTARRVLERINTMLDENVELTMKDAATVLGILADKHIALDRVDSADKDLPAVDAWLAHMMGAK